MYVFAKVFRSNSGFARSAVPCMEFANPNATGEWIMSVMNIRLPKRWNRGSITAQIHYSHDVSSASGNVDWHIYYEGLDELDKNFRDYSLSSTHIVDAVNSARAEHQITAKSANITLSDIGSDLHIINLQVCRAPTSDTFANTVFLFGIEIYWTSNANTDA